MWAPSTVREMVEVVPSNNFTGWHHRGRNASRQNCRFPICVHIFIDNEFGLIHPSGIIKQSTSLYLVPVVVIIQLRDMRVQRVGRRSYWTKPLVKEA